MLRATRKQRQLQIHLFLTVHRPGLKYWWSVIFGANLGGNITPIGSASTVVAMTIISKHKLPLSFVGFVKLASLFAVVQIIIAVAYVVGLTMTGVLSVTSG